MESRKKQQKKKLIICFFPRDKKKLFKTTFEIYLIGQFSLGQNAPLDFNLNSEAFWVILT